MPYNASMNKSDFLCLLSYSDRCWSLLRETLGQHPEAFDVPFETTSEWQSVRLLMAHTLAAEERIITARLREEPLPVRYEERAAKTLDGLYADLAEVRARTRAYLETLPEGDLEKEKPLHLPQLQLRGERTRADFLFHLLNHDNYHRGQVVMALQRLGLDPPNFDYVLLKEPAGEDGD
jgi:uncharacterized damage-inducible protein DinB